MSGLVTRLNALKFQVNPKINQNGRALLKLAQLDAILSARDVGELFGLTGQMIHYIENQAMAKIVKQFKEEISDE